MVEGILKKAENQMVVTSQKAEELLQAVMAQHYMFQITAQKRFTVTPEVLPEVTHCITGLILP